MNQMMKFLGLAVAFTAVIAFCDMAIAADREQREAQAIAGARRADVHELDAALPSEVLDRWLVGVVGPRGSIRWELNDCGEQTGNRANTPADFPICAEAVIALSDGREAGLSLAVGTAQKGVSGAPSVWSMYIKAGDQSFQHPRELRDFSRLIQSR